MNRRWTMALLMAFCGTGVGAFPALAAQWQSPLDKGLTVPPSMQKSIGEAHRPAFHIGPVAASGNGFQPCTALSGYSTEYDILYCATGTVTVKQTSSMVNLAGKAVQLVVSNMHLTTDINYIPGAWSPGAATSELTLQGNNMVTFGNVPFGSGLTTKSGSAEFKGKDAAWFADRLKQQLSTINSAFANPRPVKFEVKYGGKTVATLDCGFKAPSTITCQGSPPAPTSGPHSPPQIPPTYKPTR